MSRLAAHPLDGPAAVREVTGGGEPEKPPPLVVPVRVPKIQDEELPGRKR